MSAYYSGSPHKLHKVSLNMDLIYLQEAETKTASIPTLTDHLRPMSDRVKELYIYIKQESYKPMTNDIYESYNPLTANISGEESYKSMTNVRSGERII